jgi:hypothetical protein
MLYFITAWIILLPLCYVIGIGILNDLQVTRFQRQGDRFIAAIWLGITVLAVVLLATSLLIPLSIGASGLVTLSLLGIALRSSATRRELIALQAQVSPSVLGAILALAIGLANLTSHQVTWLDTGLYHYSIIQWLQRFGVVPGIALLFSNLGFTSSWFALTASFSAVELADRVSAVINGFTLFVAVLSAALCLHHFIKRQAAISDWFLALFLSSIFVMILRLELLQNILVSPSPDLPILLLVGVITWSILVDVSSYSSSSGSSLMVPIMLSAGAVDIKLTALPLLFITLLMLLASKPTLRQVGYIGVIIILLISPVLLSGVITSGCPLYPSSFLCLDLPWSVSSTYVQDVVAKTHQWTKWYGNSPAGGNSWLWLLWQWFENDKLNKITAFLIACSSLAAIDILSYSIKQRCYSLIFVLAIGFSGIGFVMVTSPLFRFSVSYALIIPVLYLSIKGHQLLQQRVLVGDRRLAFKPLSHTFQQGFQVTLWLLVSLLIGSSLRNNTFYLLVPPPLQTSLANQQQTNDIKYLSPKQGEVCWSTPLPCAFKVTPDIRLRDPARGISRGFVRQTLKQFNAHDRG